MSRGAPGCGLRAVVALAAVLAAAPRAKAQFFKDAMNAAGWGLRHFKKATRGYNTGKMAKKQYDAFSSKPVPFTVTKNRLVKREAKCGLVRLRLENQISAEDCGHAVLEQHGQYFLYGDDSECYMEYTKTDSCEEGFLSAASDFYAIDEYTVTAELIKHNQECKAKDRLLGNFDTVQKCATEAHKHHARFFIFGTMAPKSRKCWVKYTESAECPEGFERDFYDFYELKHSPLQRASETEGAQARLVQVGMGCKGKDVYVGWYLTPEKCASAVQDKGGHFFTYGKKIKRWLCYMEKTESVNCPEGFQKASYDFWEVLREAPQPLQV